MSNWLAIATVSGVLGARVKVHMTEAGLPFEVTVSHPLDVDTSGAFVHLYSVLPNAGLRNETLPERTPSGAVVVPPRLALDLYYQLTFVGSAANYDAERMAGAVMTGLHAHPRFAPQEIADFVAAQPAGSVLAASDLADQLEQVRITALSSDVEELARMWGMSQRNFHRLTVPYRVSAVLLEPRVSTSRPAPVTDPTVTVYQLRQPRITSAASSERQAPIVEFGEELVVAGQALRGDITLVVLADQRRPPGTLADTELRLAFDAASGLRSGVYPLQVRHQIDLPSGELRDAAASNTVPVALVPRVPPAGITVTPINDPAPPGPLIGHRVQLAVQPVPAAGQEVELSLVSTADGTQRRSSAWQLSGTDVRFDLQPPLGPGPHLVRVMVDGAESLLTQDAAGAFTGPTAAVP